MNPGDIVRVRAYGGQVLTRRVVGMKGQTVMICREDEYQAAQREGREPMCAGFPKENVVEDDGSG